MTTDLGRDGAGAPARRQPRLRLVGLALLAIGAVAALALVVPIANLTLFAEASVPPRSALPDLPDGLAVADVSDGCGSGQCYLEFDVRGPGLDAAAILERLPERERCEANGWIDRRPRCTGYEAGPHGVRGHVSIGKWLG